MDEKMGRVLDEVRKVIRGKENVIEKTLMALLAGGHILLDDVPGVGKTSLAVALGKALGLEYRRVQLTPDVLPSDIVGFSVFDKAAGTLRYIPGVVTQANLLLADEINRTSSKTQSALLEAMEEHQVTVDGTAHPLPSPFMVIATENHVGAAGTQLLPHAQLDRFLVRLSIGYPSVEAQMDMIRDRQLSDPMENVRPAISREEFANLQRQAAEVTMHEQILSYIARLAQASREHPGVELGISPRAAIGVGRMARACACLRGRDFVVPADVGEVFSDVCAHRILLSQKARAARRSPGDVLGEILEKVPEPYEK